MAEGEILASGYWCNNCGYLEQDTFGEGDIRCQGCGCEVVDHVDVDVIETLEQ
jgi:C4-type Zn-finger protein